MTPEGRPPRPTEREIHASLAALGRRALEGDLDALLGEAVERVAALLDVELAKVLELERDGAALRLRAGVGWAPGLVGTARVPARDGSQAGYTLLRDEPVVVPDLARERRFTAPELLRSHGVASGVSVVLRGDDGAFGVLGAHSRRPRSFSTTDVDVMREVANLIGLAMARAAREGELRRSERRLRRYRDLFDHLPLGVYRTRADGIVEDVNPALARILGAAGPAEIRGTRVIELYADPEDRAALVRALAEAGTVGRFEMRLRRRDGSPVPVEIHAHAVRDEAGDVIAFEGTVEDVTERQGARREIIRLNRLYSVLSAVNEAIVRESDLGALYGEICRIAVEQAGLRLAWVGTVEPSTRRVVPVAVAGPARAYLDGAHISAAEGTPAGQGPTGRAIRSRSQVVCADVATEPTMAPWRDAALAHGLRSSAAYPIVAGGRVVAALGLYADEPGFFGGDEAELLRALAADVSFAVEAHGREAERRALEAEREQMLREQRRRATELRLILDSSGEAVYGLDAGGRCSFANRPAADLFGYAPEELIGRDMHGAVHHTRADGTPRPEADCPIRATLRGAPGCRVADDVMWRRDREAVPVDYSAFPIVEDGVTRGAVVVIVDRTERKRTEEQLRQALARAEQSDRLKTAFLANMSHEIRTPLNVILGLNELVADRVRERGDAGLEDLIGAIERAGRRLLRTIHGVLDLSRMHVDAFEVRQRPVDVGRVVREQVAEHEPIAADKGLRCECRIDGALTLPFDEYCLAQALGNLIDNAIKFTERGEVTVTLRTRDPQGPTIEVSDTGVGIDERYLPLLFDEFTQEEAGYSRRFEGTGLGLALVRRYLERNGARIEVESTKGRGTKFRIRLAPKRPPEP